jgi:hypothetical protein
LVCFCIFLVFCFFGISCGVLFFYFFSCFLFVCVCEGGKAC